MTRQCPICGNKESDFITQLCSNMKIMGDHFNNTKSSLVCCKKCGLVYSDINATQEDFNKYYESSNSIPLEYYELYGEEHTEKYFNDILDKFKNVINKDSYIIDIASGSGDFAYFLKKQGYKNIYALDINEKAIESAKSKGINTILSDTINIPNDLFNKFDLAILGHSLEHYLDIDKVLLNIKNILKPQGYLYIEVPDAEKYCNTDSVPYTMFTYEHLYHFTLDTMDNIANAFGYKLIDKNQFFKAESYDVLYALFQNSFNNKPKPFKYIKTCSDAIKQYIKFSQKKLKLSIKQLELSQEELILWGIGASTALLLNETFDNCNVIQLIDRNPARQNIEYQIGNKHLKIQDPKQIKNENATIIIMPYWYHDSIKKQIEETGLNNKIKILGQEPKISILIPTFNRKEMLNFAIESAIRQTYTNFEIIIGDNCSNDGTEELCKEWIKRDKRIKYYKHNKNIGAMNNSDFLLRKANGNYFTFLCDDDWLSTDFLEKSVEFLKENPDYIFVSPSVALYKDQYSIENLCYIPNLEDETPEKRIKNFIKYFWGHEIVTGVLNIGIRDRIIKLNEKLFVARIPEDIIFMLKFLVSGKAKVLNNTHYNKLNNGATRKLNNIPKDIYPIEGINYGNFLQQIAINITKAINNDSIFKEYLTNNQIHNITQIIINYMFVKNTENMLKSKQKEIKRFIKRHPLFFTRKIFYKKLYKYKLSKNKYKIKSNELIKIIKENYD